MQTRCPADLAVRFERQREVLTREPGPLLASVASILYGCTHRSPC